MKTTPLDVRHQEFNGALSGYSRSKVRAFLADIADQFEDLLREMQSLRERVAEQERRIEEYRHSEEELKRTLVAAERITNEMKASAQREADLLVREAENERARILDELRARATEQEQAFQTRFMELEMLYRARSTELEQNFQARRAELEGGFRARASSMEQEAAARRTELENSLSRLRAERGQFLAQYRALLSGFGELARQHEAELPPSAEPPRPLEPIVARPPQAPADEDAEAPGDIPTFSHRL